MIVLLDATTLASIAVAQAGGTLAQILGGWRGAMFEVVTSDHVIAELRRTLNNPYFSRRLVHQDIETYLGFVQTTARQVAVTVQVSGVATHPEDDPVLAAAISGQATWLVTSDRRFRERVQSYRGVRLVSPAEFVKILNMPLMDAD